VGGVGSKTIIREVEFLRLLNINPYQIIPIETDNYGDCPSGKLIRNMENSI
jgi:hypothetical protein